MRFFSKPLAISLLLLTSIGASFAQDYGAKEDAKEAGRDVKHAAKKTGSAVKKGTKKATHKVAKKTRQGAEKVEEKTRP